jgi:hypothetical protein
LCIVFFCSFLGEAVTAPYSCVLIRTGILPLYSVLSICLSTPTKSFIQFNLVYFHAHAFPPSVTPPMRDSEFPQLRLALPR